MQSEVNPDYTYMEQYKKTNEHGERTMNIFDIAQKNTIMWATEEDIPEKLRNRIKATID